jgi:hypothetical protein
METYRIFIPIFAFAMGNAWAQESRLPLCPADRTSWTDCFGGTDLGYGRYVGEWKNGKPHGQGTFTEARGKYVGEFRNGNKTGQATYSWSSGSKYVGDFRDGKLNGQGVIYDARGQITESGFYENDQLVRSGVNPSGLTK